MPSNLSEYVASRYLVADPKPSTKKRKRKHDKSSSAGLIIQDDDDWDASTSSSTRKSKHHRDNDGDDDTPLTVGTVRQVRKTTKANWKSLSGGGGGGGGDDNDDSAAAADAVLASAAAENEASRHTADDDPTIVADTTTAGAARMTDGSHAGLQSAAAVTAQLARRAREEREQFEAEKKAAGGSTAHQETFYRDATGRRVDVSEKRAEARRAAAAAEDDARKRKEDLKGAVQVEAAKARRELLEEAKGMEFARGADDEEMNAALRGQMRWNDPMAKFLEVEETSVGVAAAGGSGGKGGASGLGGRLSRRPVYKGACPPNRYGIIPGYRWDGVDRGNGFEAERFKALNRRERNKDLSYQWQMDE